MTKVRHPWKLFLLPIIWLVAKIMVWELGLIHREQARMIAAGFKEDHPAYVRLKKDEEKLYDDIYGWGYVINYDGELTRIRPL